MQHLTILGSTGSIGASTLDVVARHPDRYRVLALTAFNDTLVAAGGFTLAGGVPVLHQASIASAFSGSPSKTVSTRPSGRFRTQPVNPNERAVFQVFARKKTPWTRPEIWT